MRLIVLGLFCLVARIYTAQSVDCNIDQGSTLGKLRQKLLCNYDKSDRPVVDYKKHVNVSMRMVLKSFTFYDELLTIYTTMYIKWTDEHLRWDKTEHEGIEKVQLSSLLIWTPDITLYNSLHGQAITPHPDRDCGVTFEGRVNCELPSEFSSTCIPNFKNWPYDVMNCTLLFGSWMYSGEQMDYEMDVYKVGLGFSLSQNQWKIVSASGKKKIQTFESMPNQTFPSLAFAIQLHRHAKSLAIHHVFPLVIVMVMNLMVLWLHRDGCQRYYLISASTVANVMLICNLPWQLKANGDTIPNLLLLHRNFMLVTFLLLLETVIVQLLVSPLAASSEWVVRSTRALEGNRLVLLLTAPIVRGEAKEMVDDAERGAKVVAAPALSGVKDVLATALDRAAFILFFLFYFVNILCLMPFGYPEKNN